MKIETIWLAPFIVFGLFLAVILSFSYFQQDEWHAFGMIRSYGFEYVTSGKPIWISLLSDRIGARFIMYVLFSVFNTNPVPYGLFSLIIHLLNSFLLFVLVFRTTQNKKVGIIASLFFLINSVGYQAYGWFGTMAGSATSVTFILLSLIFYFNFLIEKKYIYSFLSFLFLWISFLFKEVGYFLFAAYPILWFAYIKNMSVKLFIKDNLLFLIYGIILTIFFIQSILFIPGVRANYVAPESLGLIKIPTHLISYPLEGISQIFIPSSFVFGLAWIFTRLLKPSLEVDTSPFDQFYTVAMANYISVILSIILVIFSTVFYKKYVGSMKKNIKLLFLSSISILILSFLPYAVLDKFDAYLDLRHYYPIAIGASMIVGVMFFSLFSIAKNSKRKIAIMFFAGLFAYHGIALIDNLFNQLLISQERISILNQIKKIAPNLPDKTVFFVTGNSPGYYGIEELKIPFQSGFGQVLMIAYSSGNSFYSLLFKEESFWKTADGGFLYDTLAQGYRETNGVGFGYYYDRKILKEELDKKLFSKESVISLFYDSDQKKIIEKNFGEINF